jgi:hypothetical protein
MCTGRHLGSCQGVDVCLVATQATPPSASFNSHHLCRIAWAAQVCLQCCVHYAPVEMLHNSKLGHTSNPTYLTVYCATQQ